MSFFDKLRGNTPGNLYVARTMLLACITMIAADGHVDDDEMAIIHRIDAGESPANFNEAVRVWKQVGRSLDCVAVVTPMLNPAQRRFTLANLVDIAMADGNLEGAEMQLLEEYLAAFELDEAFVNALAEVIAIKNDRSPFLS